MKRNTLQKKIVLQTLAELRNHPTATMVYQAVHRQYPNISRSTVFRILASLSEDGTILRFPVPNAELHYDHQTHPHYHIRCRNCGEIADVSFDSEDSVFRLITDRAGFEVEQVDLFFTGLCPKCRT